MSQAPDLFAPFKLGPVTLRNRFIRAGANEGMVLDGAPTRALVKHHRDMAAGGVGLTTVAYGAVAKVGRTLPNQVWMRPEILPDLKALADAVHADGGAISYQLTHGGSFVTSVKVDGPTMSASGGLNKAGLMRGTLADDALTTQVANLKKQIKESDPKTSGKSKDPKNPKKTGKKGEEGKNWRYTKVGDTIQCPESGATLKWCPHHGTGAYMPADHNHKEWAENKRKRQEQYEQKRDAKRVRFEGDTNAKSDGDKCTDEKHPSKLQLGSALRQSLVTQCSMTPTEADSILDQVFASANGGLKE